MRFLLIFRPLVSTVFFLLMRKGVGETVCNKECKNMVAAIVEFTSSFLSCYKNKYNSQLAKS